uniref:DEUBAD domain-containing protein n=1 Tax=Setaria italica TaxID=4555 RepID=K3ZQH1_SETIT
MTCRMSASKQKKRQINYTNSEQCRPGKKTKFDSSNCLVSLKPHIGLKWDQYLRRVVPEKEQVGILWSDLAPFMENQEHCSGLADVTYVPPETFSLESLRGVLSYEVWSTCLTETERKFLKQFLPSETDAEENVHLLLTGKNHHFGNPFLSWSSSLCYGDIHPDAILNKEKHIKKDEKAYRVNLLNYHSNMVDTLKKWKKRWLNCGDIENLFRDNPGNQKQVAMQQKATKGGMPMKVAQRVDVSKFMSYIKVSRTQLNHIKRLKQSGDGIQTKHVSRVIGGLDKSHVKPYGALLEDEHRRLREHWLNMSCNDLPAAFEVLKDRKALMEKSRKLLGLELEEKNVSVSRKADQLTDITNELGQPGASENDGSPILQNGQVEHSPQSMFQGGDGQSTTLQDQDDEQTKYMETCIFNIDSRNVEDHDLMVVRGTDITSESEQNSDVQDRNGVSCVDESTSCCANNPDKQNEDLTDIKLRKDGLGVNSEDIQEISCKGTTINNNNSSESQGINSINNTSTHIDTLDCENLQLEDLDGVSYKGPSVHAHEQDQDLESISHDVLNHNCDRSANISSEVSHPKMNTVIVDQEETENVMMIPLNSCSLIPKSSGEQMHVEGFLDLNDQVTKGEKNRWRLAGPLQSHYHPPENITFNGSGNLQITQPYLSSGQRSSSVYLDNGVLSQQQDQLTTSAFIMDNPSSVIEPFSNLQSNGQLQMVKDIGAVSYPLQHANSIEQSTGLHSLANNRLEQQLTDQSDNCLYGQLHKDIYADVSFPTKVNPPISGQHSYAAFASMDHRYNWFADGCQSHNNNLSGLESGNCLTEALPSGSNTHGTLFSAISQYKQPSLHVGHGGSSPSQLLEPRNQVCPPQNFLPRSQDTNLPFSDMYGYTQNVASGTSSQVAPVGSLDGSHWTNFIQQSPGMLPDITNRPFRGPWTR